MLILKTIWMYYRISICYGWAEDESPEKAAYLALRDSLHVFMVNIMSDSKFWVVWLVVLWLLAPIALMYQMVRLYIRDLKKEVFS